MKYTPTAMTVLITVLTTWTYSAAWADGAKKTRKPAASDGTPPTAQQLTDAYNAIAGDIAGMTPAATSVKCGPGNVPSSVCYKGPDGCIVTIATDPKGFLHVDVDPPVKYNATCELYLGSPSSVPRSMTFSPAPNLSIGATIKTTDPDHSSVDHCTITLSGRTVNTTMNEGAASCTL